MKPAPVDSLVERLLASSDPEANLQSLAALVKSYPQANVVEVGGGCVEFRLGAGASCTEFELAPRDGQLYLFKRSFAGERTHLGTFPNHTAAMARATQVHQQSRVAESDSGARHYKVCWTDRNYRDQSKVFDGPDAEKNLRDAREFRKKMEASDDQSKYGDIRGPVTIRPL